MTIFKHELKQNRTAFFIWTIVISYMLGICIFIYPEMKDEMENAVHMDVSLDVDLNVGDSWYETK